MLEVPPTAPALRVLVIDDNRADARLVEITLELESPGGFAVTHAAAVRDALRALDAQAWDLVLLDLTMPEMAGGELVRTVAARARGAAVVVLSGHEDPSLAADARAAGAWDYLVKGESEGPELAARLRAIANRDGRERPAAGWPGAR